MKPEVIGHIFSKVWDIAQGIKKLRKERRIVNIGSGTVGITVYEVKLPEDTIREGICLITPSGIRLYYQSIDQYEIGYLISELDEDPLVVRHFKK